MDLRGAVPADSTQSWRRLAWILAGLASAGMAVQPRIAEDTWWHLAVGRWIFEHHAIPSHDPFSSLDRPEGAPWRAYSWLFEAFLFRAWSQFGPAGILWAKFLLSSLSALAVCGYLGNRVRGKWSGPLLAAITLPAFWPMFTERPWHLTIWGTLATLKVLDELMTRPVSLRRVLWLVPVYVVWANTHIQFVLGLGLLAAGLAVSLVRQSRHPGVSSAGTLMILLPLCFLATLVTPYHFGLYQVVWEYATQTGALGLIDELKPPRLANWWTWPLVALSILASVRLLRDGLPLWETILLGIGLFFACRMQRDGWLGCLLAARALLSPGGRVAQPMAAVFWPALGFAVVRMVWASGLIPTPAPEEVIRRDYPTGAIEWVRENRPFGPLFNSFDWGGYLIWELPGHLVNIDGRSNLYGDARLSQSVRTWTVAGESHMDADLAKARLVIAPASVGGRELPLVTELRQHWRIAYEDAVAIVFVRDQPN